MLDHDIRHLPVLSASDEVLGVVTDVDLLAAQARTPFVLRRAIADAGTPRSCATRRPASSPTVVALHHGGLAPGQISAIISVVVETLVRRMVELAAEAAGRPRPSSRGSRSAVRRGARPFPPRMSTPGWSGRTAEARRRRRTCTPSQNRCTICSSRPA